MRKIILAVLAVTLGLVGRVQADCDSRTTTCLTAIDVSGNAKVGSLTNTGAATVTGNSTISGNQSLTGNLTMSGKEITPRATITGVTIATTVVPTATFMVLTTTSPAATIVSTAVPTFSAGTDGQWLVIKGTSSVATTTLQDNGTLAGSTLELGAASRVISDLKVLTLIYDSTVAKWVEMSYGNN